MTTLEMSVFLSYKKGSASGAASPKQGEKRRRHLRINPRCSVPASEEPQLEFLRLLPQQLVDVDVAGHLHPAAGDERRQLLPPLWHRGELFEAVLRRLLRHGQER